MSGYTRTVVEVGISAETQERIAFLAMQWGLDERQVAEKLLADQAEAEAALLRGPFLRKHMYR